MNRKTSITQFTEAEFLQLTKDICDAVGDDDQQDDNYILFDTIVEHPLGADLIFWPNATEDGCPGEPANVTPEQVVARVKAWYTEHNKPCFKKG